MGFFRKHPALGRLAAVLFVTLLPNLALASPTVKLALNWKPEPQFGGFYAAHFSDLDKKNGLSLDILPGGAGTPVVQMVAAGQVEFGIASADEVVISRSMGSDVVALFAVFQTNPQAVMTHAERGFKSLPDVYLSEGILAVQKGLPYERFMEKKIDGLKVKRKAQLVPYQGGISGFLTDATYSQQCFLTSEPLTAQKRGVQTKTFLVADEGFNPYTTVLITRASFMKQNRGLVRSVVNAVRAGWRGYLDQPELTNRKMSELNKSMDPSTFAESAKAQKPLIDLPKAELGSMTRARWETLAHQLKDLALITVVPPIDQLFSAGDL